MNCLVSGSGSDFLPDTMGDFAGEGGRGVCIKLRFDFLVKIIPPSVYVEDIVHVSDSNVPSCFDGLVAGEVRFTQFVSVFFCKVRRK